MKKETLLPLNLQYFAEGEGEPGEGTPPSGQPDPVDPPTKGEEPEGKKEFTAEDVQKMIDERLSRERKKSEKEKEEASKLAKMSADERKEHEIEVLKQELEAAKRTNARGDMEREARVLLTQANVTVTDEELAFVVTDEAESTKENVTKLTTLIERVRSEITQELLKGTTPKVPETATGTTSSKQFETMTYAERSNLQKENPSEFNRLVGGK